MPFPTVAASAVSPAGHDHRGPSKGQLRQLVQPLRSVFAYVHMCSLGRNYFHPDHTQVGVVHSHPVQFVIADVFIILRVNVMVAIFSFFFFQRILPE